MVVTIQGCQEFHQKQEVRLKDKLVAMNLLFCSIHYTLASHDKNISTTTGDDYSSKTLEISLKDKYKVVGM